MKKIRYITILALAIFGFQACTKDFLELQPKTGLVEENFYRNDNDAFLALVGCYDALTVQNWQFVPIMSDIFSDDAFTGGSDATDMSQWQEIEQSRMTDANNTISDLWNRCYSAIYRCNLYLQKEGQITWENEENRTRFAAEAKFIRAYIYWDLARHYGWVPIITEVLPSVEDYRNVTQNTPDEVYKQAAKDLLASLPGLPEVVPQSEAGRATKYAAEALMARIYLFYTGIRTAIPELGLAPEWTDGTTVIDKTMVTNGLEDVINNGPYELMADYADLFDWAHENNQESIFEWQFSEKAKSSDWGAGWGINGNFAATFYGIRNPEGYGGFWDTGWALGTITWSLVNEYEANDPRFDVTVFNADENLTKYTRAFENTGYFNRKFMARAAYHATAGTYEHNWPVNFMDIRLADVLLMASELNLESNPGKALDYLNRVRARAMGSEAALTTLTLEDIMHERRIELAGEGSRKWDLLRMGLDYAKARIDASFNVPDNIPNKQDFIGRSFDTQTYGMFPIPGGEIRNCNDGVLKQYVPKYK